MVPSKRANTTQQRRQEDPIPVIPPTWPTDDSILSGM